MQDYSYKHYVNSSDLYAAVAESICNLANESVKKNGRFTMVLSGGSTPKQLYEKLASSQYQEIFPWEDSYIFWGDERFVSYDDPSSNYGMVYDALLSNVPIPKENIFRVLVNQKTVKQSAEKYALTIKQFFGKKVQFDLVLLGIGLDGHTASLFPDTEAFKEKKKLIVDVFSKKANPPVKRISMTLPLINNAEQVFFLVAGIEKREITAQVLRSYKKELKYPAAFVHPRGGLTWFTDFKIDL